MKLETFFEKFDQFADAPHAVAKMRELVLLFAVTGRLVPHDKRDGTASLLLESTAAERAKLVAARKIKSRPTSPVEIDEQPFGVPSGWAWVRLSDVGYELGQKIPDKRFTYIDVGGIDSDKGRISDRVEKLEPGDAPSRARKLVARGTVIYSTVRPYLLNIAIVDQDFDPEPIASTAFGILHPFAQIADRYLFYWLRSAPFTDYVEAGMKGMAYPAINDEKFYSGPIALPPFAEQKRIVAKVDELMALCDQLEAQLQERETRHFALARASLARFADAPTLANLKFLFHKSYAIPPADLRKSILTLAVQGKLVPQDPNDEPAFERKEAELDFDSPPGWLSGTVFDLTVLKSGNSFPNDEELAEGEYLYVKVSDMNLPENQREISTSSRFINPNDRDLRALIPANAIVFPKRGGAIATNKKRLVKAPIFVDSNTMAMICPPFIELRYLHTWFSGIDLWELNSGTSVPQINNKDIGPLVIPVPPLAEQRRIVAKVEHLMALVDALETQLAASRTTAANLLSALVAELTTGNEIHAVAEV